MEAGAVPRVASPRMPALAPGLLRLATDARLVSLVREGRSGAFEAVYDRHQRGILSFCRHMLGDQHEAEDAVQHTFMAAFSALHNSQKPIHLRPWLFAIARNRCYSVLRARRERPAAEIEEAITEGLAAEVQRRQDLRDLVHDLSRLPDEQRAAIVLAELESLSHADIAEVLGVPREKVKALVFQARESLMASRTARETACHEIRQQLAVGRGGALRRGNLRRHLRDCEGCRAYRTQVQRQRKQFAVLLPVAPTLLIKEGLLAAVGGGAAAVGGSGVIASSALKTGLLKGLVTAIVAGAGTLGTVMVSASNLPVRSLLSGSGNPAVQARVPGAHDAARGAHHRGTVRVGGSTAASVVVANAATVARHASGAESSHPAAGLSVRHRAAGGARGHHQAGARLARAARMTGHSRHASGTSARLAAHASRVPPGLARKLHERVAMLYAARMTRSRHGHAARLRDSGRVRHAGHVRHPARLRHASRARHAARVRHTAHARHAGRARHAARAPHIGHQLRLRNSWRAGHTRHAAAPHGRGHH